MNKKSQIAWGITWFIGFIIIIITILFLLIVSGALAVQKKVPIFGEGADEIILEVYSENIEVKRNLVGVLNYPIEEDTRIVDLILRNLDDYYEIKSEHPGKGSLIGLYGVDGLSEIKVSEAEVYGFDRDEVARLDVDNQIFAGLIVKELKKRCNRFYLLIPQGLINEDGLLASKNVLGQDVFKDGSDFIDYTPSVTLKMYYKNYNFEIKYRQLKECENDP